MRAIIIDPFTKTVTETTIPDNTTKSIRAAVFGPEREGLITRSNLGGGIDIWLDDDGLMHEGGEQRFFHFTVHRPAIAMAGRGVMLGISHGGNTIGLPSVIKAEEVATMIAFVGDDDGLEAAIQAGAVARPNSTIREIEKGVEKVTTLWEWRPTPKE